MSHLENSSNRGVPCAPSPYAVPGAVTVARKVAPNESWVRKLWGRRRDGPETAKADLPPGSLLAFAPEEPARPVQERGAPHQSNDRQQTPRWAALTHAQAATAAVVLVAIAQGTLIAVLLQSRGASRPPAHGRTRNHLRARWRTPVCRRYPTRRHARGRVVVGGEHRIDIGEGTALRSRTVNVSEWSRGVCAPGTAARFAQASAPATGGLQITTDPSGAQVSVDGQSRGAAPLSVTNLPPGLHRVTVSGPRGRITREVASSGAPCPRW